MLFDSPWNFLNILRITFLWPLCLPQWHHIAWTNDQAMTPNGAFPGYTTTIQHPDNRLDTKARWWWTKACKHAGNGGRRANISNVCGSWQIRRGEGVIWLQVRSHQFVLGDCEGDNLISVEEDFYLIRGHRLLKR